MKCIEKPYISSKMEKDSKKFLRKLKANKNCYLGYVVTLGLQPDNLLDIFPAAVLNQSYYKRRDITVVGIAQTKEEAIGLIEQIVMDCYKQTDDFNVKEFILCNY